MADLTELQRLAEGASPGEWEARQRDWGYPEHEGGEVRRLWEIYAGGVTIAGLTIFSLDERDAAFIAAMSPDTAKKLIAVALLADALVNPPQMATGYHQRKQREADEDNLRTALEELKHG